MNVALESAPEDLFVRKFLFLSLFIVIDLAPVRHWPRGFFPLSSFNLPRVGSLVMTTPIYWLNFNQTNLNLS